MSPRIRKTQIDSYRPVLSIDARDSFTDLAGGLGFFVTRRGTYEGLPSVTDFFEALAAAYRDDPGGVHLALKVIGVYNKDDATPDADADA